MVQFLFFCSSVLFLILFRLSFALLSSFFRFLFSVFFFCLSYSLFFVFFPRLTKAPRTASGAHPLTAIVFTRAAEGHLANTWKQLTLNHFLERHLVCGLPIHVAYRGPWLLFRTTTRNARPAIAPRK